MSNCFQSQVYSEMTRELILKSAPKTLPDMHILVSSRQLMFGDPSVSVLTGQPVVFSKHCFNQTSSKQNISPADTSLNYLCFPNNRKFKFQKRKKKLDKNYKSLPTSLGNQNIKSMD